MQKKAERKKLVLRKETIANLSDLQLTRIIGGEAITTNCQSAAGCKEDDDLGDTMSRQCANG